MGYTERIKLETLLKEGRKQSYIAMQLGVDQVGFVTFILNLTNIFVAPASGIFPSQMVEGGYFEAVSIVAILMWLILATILAVVINLFSSKAERVV